jgi:hypothetical protein
LRRVRGGQWYHGAVAALFRDRVTGVITQFAASHLTPWRLPRPIEAEQLVPLMTRPSINWPLEYAHRAWPGVLGTDSNGLASDRVQGPDGTLGDHSPDIYRQAVWFDDLLHQCKVSHDPATGERTYRVDRDAGDQLFNGGLHEAAAVLGVPPVITTGHWRRGGDSYAEQGIRQPLDHLRVTGRDGIDLRPMLRSVTAIGNNDVPGIEDISDHLPVLGELGVTE